MNSRERILAAVEFEAVDRVPLVCRCFGLQVPPNLRWTRDGKERRFWYTMRLEHIHTLPQPWDVEDDFQRVERWLNLGIDDVLEVSPPWSLSTDVTVAEWEEEPTSAERHPLSCREYRTPAGPLLHKVRRTEEKIEAGWVLQPEFPPIFEDFNIPRGAKHLVSEPADIEKLSFLLQPATPEQRAAYADRMKRVQTFAEREGVPAAAWSLFGMDAIVWVMGAEGAVMMAMTEPEALERLVKQIGEFDRARNGLALETGGIDVVVQRGWYSSTDFWSPALFRRFVLPELRKNVEQTHGAGIKFAYVMTTGLMPMLDALIESGIDLLYWADPVQGDVDLETLREKCKGKLAIAGGVNSAITLGKGSPDEIQAAVNRALQTLGPDGFILEPVDSLFPDTPWEAVEAMIEAWKAAW